MKKIFLIDYDGTTIYNINENGFPIDDTGATKVLKKIVDSGHRIVLWTCRNTDPGNPYNKFNKKYSQPNSLSQAVSWFRDRGIPLYGVNDVPGMENLIGTSRKLLGDILIDDTSIGIPKVFKEDVKYFDLDTEEIKTTPGISVDWNYIESWLLQEGLI